MDNSEYLRIIEDYPKHERYTLAILQDIQRKYNYLPHEALTLVSEYLGVPMNKLFGIATFYKAFSLEAKGKHIIKVCKGTACHVRGSDNILEEFEKLLGIHAGERTEDGMFSIDIVNCVGACALAPVVVIDDKYYGRVKVSDVKDIIESYRGDSNE